jgi:PAS domain S-box-containing protein
VLSGLGAALLDALPLGIYAVDQQLRVVAWNREREQGPIGRPRRRVLGKPLGKVLPPGGYRALEPLLRRIFETGEAQQQVRETRLGARLFQVGRTPVLQDGRVTHVVSRFEDVTERRALEMRVIASDRLAFLGQLVAGVAHEIANPLASVAGCAEALFALASLAPSSKERREAQQFLGLIRAEIQRCQRLVGTLLASVKPAKGERSDVGEVVAIVLRLLERHPAFTRVKVSSRIPEKLLARIDPDSLKQVVIALATNAGDAMQGHGALRIAAGRAGARVVLDVSDSGPGLTPEARARLFEPYFTSDPARGAGLGLAIARSLVRARGGELLLRPARKGAAFRVVLERARAER